jgi:uncharacterized protein (DUF58 family)
MKSSAIRLARVGWLWLLIAVLVLVLGIVKSINLLALLGTVLVVVLLLNALVVGRRLRGLEARCRLDELLFAGSSCRIEVLLRNPGPRPCPGVRLEMTRHDQTTAWYLDQVEAQGRPLCRGEVGLPQRGLWYWGPLTASSGQPFGLVRRRVVLGPRVRLLVLPRPRRLDRDRLRRHLRGADPYAERARRRGWRHETAQADFHGLRPFRPGDSPRWIHWRTSARRGELMVREFEDVPGDDLVLVLAPPGANATGLADVEAVIDAAATIVWEWCRRRGDRLVLVLGGEVHDGVAGPDHARRLLGRLALLEPEDLAEPDLAALHELPATLTVAVLCVGPTDLAARLEGALRHPVARQDVAEPRQWGYDP